MAAWLTARGHEVRVVTAPPYYPAWKISPGYSGRAWRTEVWQGVTVLRCPLWVAAAPPLAWPRPRVLLAALALALLTEGLQFFAIDRHPRLLDVGIDLAGAGLGLAVVWVAVVWVAAHWRRR